MSVRCACGSFSLATAESVQTWTSITGAVETHAVAGCADVVTEVAAAIAALEALTNEQRVEVLERLATRLSAS